MRYIWIPLPGGKPLFGPSRRAGFGGAFNWRKQDLVSSIAEKIEFQKQIVA